MDYEQFALQHYEINTDNISEGDFIFFLTNGELDIQSDTGFVETGSDFESLFYFGCNYYNRFVVSEHSLSNLVSFGYCFSKKDILFCNTNRLEFGVYGSSNSTGTLYGHYFKEGDSLDDLSTITNYYHSNGSNPFGDYNDEDLLYGSYNINLTGQNPYAVFDYLNIKYDEGVSPYMVIRGENQTMYNICTELALSTIPNTIYFSYGAPTYSQYQQGYSDGYNNGFGAGWTQGNENGFIIGQNSNGNITQAPATAFDYIGSAFGAVSNIMALEILPNITLGLAFSIPMVFVLIMTIFKLVRK